MVLALRKSTLSLILTVYIVVIWHENIVLYYTDVYVYKILNEKKMYTYTSCKLEDIYANVYIHLCACVHIHNMYICIPARHPRNHPRCGAGETSISVRSHARFGKFYIVGAEGRILPKFWSQMTRPVLSRPRRRGTKEERHRSRDQFKIVRAGDVFRGFLFRCHNNCDVKLAYR